MKGVDPHTLQGKVLTYLKTGHSLDHPKSTALFGVFRLPVAVQYLRKKGYDIRTNTATPPEGKAFSIYVLPKVIDKDTRPGTKVRVQPFHRMPFSGRVGTLVRHALNPQDMGGYECSVSFDGGSPFCFKYSEIEPEFINEE